jgi:hypothetical protein
VNKRDRGKHFNDSPVKHLLEIAVKQTLLLLDTCVVQDICASFSMNCFHSMVVNAPQT